VADALEVLNEQPLGSFHRDREPVPEAGKLDIQVL
jgi:hypothetical protein